jgi:hypothetical protein
VTRSSSARLTSRILPLVLAGVAAAALYVSIVEIAAELTPGYSHVAQPVSSLYQSGSAIGLPVAAAFVVYNALVAAFGIGVVRLAQAWPDRGRAGVATGVAVVLLGLAGAIDDVFAQDPIGTTITTVGTLHIAFAGIASLLTVVAMALAAWWLLGRRELRPLAWYSVASFVAILAFGPITAAATASSSPVMGLLERVTILTFTLWMAVTSVVLARRCVRAEGA